MTDIETIHHYMGIEMNIQTWNLLGKDDRTEQDDTRMINFAKASLYHWRKSPKYKPENEQRGQWMISHVFAVLGNGKQALEFAKETLRLTEKHKFTDFDLAYAYECMARAYATLGNTEKCRNWRERAKSAGELIHDKEDKKYFDDDFNAEPWFDCC